MSCVSIHCVRFSSLKSEHFEFHFHGWRNWNLHGCLSYCSIAMMRQHDPGNLSQKVFDWGFAFSFRALVYNHQHESSVTGDRRTQLWNRGWELRPDSQAVGRERPHCAWASNPGAIKRKAVQAIWNKTVNISSCLLIFWTSPSPSSTFLSFSTSALWSAVPSKLLQSEPNHAVLFLFP